MIAIATPKHVLKYRKIVKKYCDDVLKGRLVVGKLERDAVQRYLDDLKSAKKARAKYYLDENAAAMACEFFPTLLVHGSGEYAGTPFELYPIQVFTVWNIFGWKRKKDGLRRFREVFYSVGRGNGKTPLAVGIVLQGMGFDDPIEAQAECYIAATKRDQAAIGFNDAKRFVQMQDALSCYFEVLKYNISIPANNSKLEPLSGDGKTMDGLRIHFLMRDELHAWTEHHRDYYEKLETALGKRRQPLALTTTTAGDENSQLWREQYEHARKTVSRDNPLIDDELFVMICEIDDDDDELDEKVWPKANPLMRHGVVKVDAIRRLALKAKSQPSIRHELKRYHCNKLTYSFAKSIDDKLWSLGKVPEVPPLTITPHGAVDLGWKDDLAAIGWCFPLDKIDVGGTMKRRYFVDADVWIPAGTKRDLLSEPFRTLVREGHISKTESEWTDTKAMYARLRGRIADHGCRTIAYDPNNAREFALNCVNDLGLETYAFSQTHQKYNEPLREFLVALSEKRILHDGNPLLAWCATNLVEEANSKDERMPSKKRSIDKIDPIVAIIMAFSECLFAEPEINSVYEERGPLVFG